MQNNIEVIAATADLLTALQSLDYRFTVTQELEAVFDRPVREGLYTVAPREKNYFNNPQQFSGLLNNRDGALYIALAAGQPAGYLAVSRNWNGLALVDDLAVDAAFRRSGCGYALLQRAISWAQGQQLAGVTLETQNTNVAACLLYEKMGFELGGIDRQLYRALHAHPAETALYWYLWFSRTLY